MVNIKLEGVEQTRREHSGVTQTTLGCQRRLARGSWVHTQGKRRSKPGTGAVLGIQGSRGTGHASQNVREDAVSVTARMT